MMTHVAMNMHGPLKILAAVEDAAVLEALVGLTTSCLHAHVSCASTGKNALAIDRQEGHHVVLASVVLPDMSGLDLAKRLLAQRRRPVMLIGDRPTADDAIAAMRVGVCDFLATPIDATSLSESVGRALWCCAAERRVGRRHDRMRSLVRRVLGDRRNLGSGVQQRGWGREGGGPPAAQATVRRLTTGR